MTTEFDGKTTSNNAFSGSVGKNCRYGHQFLVRDSISKLYVKIELIELREEVIKSLSHYRKYLYIITYSIKSGIFHEDLKD